MSLSAKQFVVKMSVTQKKYSFEVKRYLESKFTVYDDAHPQDSEQISGSIVLYRALQLTLDKKGGVIFES